MNDKPVSIATCFAYSRPFTSIEIMGRDVSGGGHRAIDHMLVAANERRFV